MPVDLLFVNGVVLTMDDAQPTADAVAVIGSMDIVFGEIDR